MLEYCRKKENREEEEGRTSKRTEGEELESGGKRKVH